MQRQRPVRRKEIVGPSAKPESMPDLTAKRTLVKSPPELWEELSEVERLARHLGAFGDIRITKLEPEHTVAWEGEHASGTVSIEPSGWGTKVTLKAELPVAEVPAAEPVADVEPEPVAEAEPEVAEAEPEPVAEPEPELAEADPEPAAEAEAEPKRRFWARLLGRRTPEIAPVAAEAAPPAEAPPAAAEPVATEPRVAEPEAAEPQVAEAEAAEPEPPAPGPEVPAEADRPRSGLDEDGARAVLDGALDALGAAHHRPFSRG
jgi:hypothetical protein